MARDITGRLDRLRTRRRGIDRLGRLNEMARDEVLRKSTQDEAYQTRARTQAYTRYALGAMQEVDPDYTRIGLETAERVGNQLNTGLTAAGFSVGFRLQGSVPLNVHIRGVSDVDLLTLDTDFYTYHAGGVKSQLGYYRTPTQKTSLGVLWALRQKSEEILKAKFPEAEVDTSGGKAIAISGGSLPRPVDVVPSHWHDNEEYQRTQVERDRTVTILNKKIPETVDNLPFVHIFRITLRDEATYGGLKKAIRLCKNVKNDAIDEGRNIVFPSFDIAATLYHADMSALQRGRFYELAILAETQRFLDYLYHNPTEANALFVPDGSRRIFDTEQKYNGLKILSVEMDDLLKEVAKEQGTRRYNGNDVLTTDGRNTLSNAIV